MNQIESIKKVDEFPNELINITKNLETTDSDSRKAQINTCTAPNKCNKKDEKERIKQPTPLRLQEHFRRRRMNEYRERARALKHDHYVIRENKTMAIKVKNSIKIPAERMLLVEVEPFEVCNDFMMVTPNEKYLNHEKLEVLDGSYYHTHGGYVLVQNRSSEDFTLSANLKIGEGRILDKSQLPKAMDDEAVDALETVEFKAMCVTAELNNKEKSRAEFRVEIEKYPKRLKDMLRKYEEMFLEPNELDFETLNIKDLDLMEREDKPDTLPQVHRRVRSKEDEDAIRSYVEAGMLSGFTKKPKVNTRQHF